MIFAMLKRGKIIIDERFFKHWQNGMLLAKFHMKQSDTARQNPAKRRIFRLQATKKRRGARFAPLQRCLGQSSHTPSRVSMNPASSRAMTAASLPRMCPGVPQPFLV